MVFWLASLAAATPPITDVDDARYLLETGRVEPALAWFRDQLDAEPDNPRALENYLTALSWAPGLRTPALPGLVDRWLEDHPTPMGPAVRALSYVLVEMSPGMLASTPFAGAQPGPWCTAAQDALAEAPAEVKWRYAVVRVRNHVAQACGAPTDALQDELRELGQHPDMAGGVRAFWGFEDGVDAADVAALREAFPDDPVRIRWMGRFLSDDATGEAVEEAREILLAVAREIAASDRPAHVYAAIGFFASADLQDGLWAARAHLKELDPGNGYNAAMLARGPRTPADPDETLEPSQLLDSAARLAALQAAKPPRDRYDRRRFWHAWVDAAAATGDRDAYLRGLDRLLRGAPSNSVRLDFARTAVEQDRRLGRAQRLAGRVVRTRRGLSTPFEVDQEWAATYRENLAKALEVQARVFEARGRAGPAREARLEAVALAPATPEQIRQVVRGLPANDLRTVRALGAALAADPEVDDEAAWTRLEEALEAQGVWAPGGPVAYVQALPKPDVSDDAVEELDATVFRDIDVEWYGTPRRLLDVEGPVVVDVWATWCGPCVDALPHVSALAERYEGRVTFVALSVDDERATADAYLARHGGGAFETAWAGREGTHRMGINGIPAYLLFDHEHRLVTRLAGWSPGSRALDRAIERMLVR